jgi:hypothetical protein
MRNTQRALDAVLRQDLAAFIHKSFQTVCPGETYEHAWYIDCIAIRLRRSSASAIPKSSPRSWAATLRPFCRASGIAKSSPGPV